MTARKQAIEDIHRELLKEEKCFIQFRQELNAPIRKIVKHYIKLQKEVSK